jgi:uncharacterized protein YkwD
MKSSLILFSLILSFSHYHPADPSSGTVCLSAEETKLYNLIMTYRAGKRLKPIPFSAKMTKVAQAHVHDLMQNFDYDNKNGCNPHSWSGKGTWTPCCYTPDHQYAKCMWNKPQEIAGYSGNGFEIAYYSSAAATAEEGLEGWKKSAGHNPLLVNSGMWSKVQWKSIGVGIFEHYAVVWFGETEDPSEMTNCP